MAAARRSLSRISPAPPPTPIATGKGTLSAAVDDRVLADYLEASLKIPDLTLPESFPARSPTRIPDVIDLGDLVSGEEAVDGRVIDAAAAVGACRVDGGMVAEELGAVVDVGRVVFGLSEEEMGALKGFIRRGEGFVEVSWARPSSTGDVSTWPSSYRMFREKLENVVSKLEMVAECIGRTLSKSIRNQGHTEKFGKKESVVCLRKYSYHQTESNRTDHRSHAISLHISGYDHEFRICSPGCSASFVLPAGSILVTIQKQLEEWCNGEFHSPNIDSLLRLQNDEQSPVFMEFMCSPLALDCENDHATKTVSIMDQVLILLVLVFLYKLWAFISSYLTESRVI